jgi:hypothetical protein
MDLGRFRYRTNWHHHVNRSEYDAPPDPWKLLPVSPDEVTYYNGELRLNWGLGRVQGGEWDRTENCRPFRETTLYRGLKQRFEDGHAWEQTALYQVAREQFETGETVRGYESLAEFRAVRCEYIDDLFRKIEREGYRPNREASHERATDENPFENAYANHLEPLVVIGRTGDVYLTEGNHRFAIASILGIDEIPMYVLCRHEQWQAIRDQIHGTPEEDLPPERRHHLGHPDVRDLSRDGGS